MSLNRMKHLDLRWYWLRDVVEAGLVKPSYVPTEDMAADILIKVTADDGGKRLSSSN